MLSMHSRTPGRIRSKPGMVRPRAGVWLLGYQIFRAPGYPLFYLREGILVGRGLFAIKWDGRGEWDGESHNLPFVPSNQVMK